MKLVILESKAKARTIKKYLGKGWIVDACNGHVQDLPNDSKAMWASKSGELPKPRWSWTDRAERVVTKIVDKANKSGVEEIFIATDPDREGEFIAWRLQEILSDFKSVRRVSFNEITKDAVKSAINNPKGLDMGLVEAAMVRRFMDRLVGFRCSKFCRSWKLRSMGRVQTPTLGFVVEREIEREAHVPIEYHSVIMESNGIELKVRFHESEDDRAWRDDAGKYYPDRTFDGERAIQLAEKINASRELSLKSVKEGTVNRKPQPPFTTDTLLQTASSTLGWAIGKTSAVASSLYQSGHITYIRTDSTRTNETARNEIRELIENKYGGDHLGPGVGEGSNSGENVQDAHEAIRPTNPVAQNIEIEKDEKSLYRLIWSRFAASQMSSSVRERRQIVFTLTDMEEEIYGTASWRIHPGWESVFDWANKEIRVSPPDVDFEIGEIWSISDQCEIITDETKPPRRLSESSIIQQMKKAGIGRPSTYVTTVTKLVDRGYIDKEGSSLSPTLNGRTLWIDVVPFYNDTEMFGEGLFTTGFTSSMEEKLDSIGIGHVEGSAIWEDFLEVFRSMHNNALEKRRERPTLRQMQYLGTILSRLSEEERNSSLGEKTIEELSGQEARDIIDKLSKGEQGKIPASEKQLGLIMKLVEKLNVDLISFIGEMGLKDVEELTGGRDGTASELIGKLIEIDGQSPATEKQVSAIISMVDRIEMPIEQALEMVGAESIEAINKSEASSLISTIKKLQGSKRKKKKKK